MMKLIPIIFFAIVCNFSSMASISVTRESGQIYLFDSEFTSNSNHHCELQHSSWHERQMNIETQYAGNRPFNSAYSFNVLKKAYYA